MSFKLNFSYYRRICLKVFRRICWKYGRKTPPQTLRRWFLENFPKKYSSERHRTDTFDSCFNGWLIGKSWLKWRHLYVLLRRSLDLNFSNYGVSTGRGTFWTHSSLVDGFFARIVKGFKSMYFRKKFHRRYWKGSWMN